MLPRVIVGKWGAEGGRRSIVCPTLLGAMGCGWPQGRRSHLRIRMTDSGSTSLAKYIVPPAKSST